MREEREKKSAIWGYQICSIRRMLWPDCQLIRISTLPHSPYLCFSGVLFAALANKLAALPLAPQQTNSNLSQLQRKARTFLKEE